MKGDGLLSLEILDQRTHKFVFQEVGLIILIAEAKLHKKPVKSKVLGQTSLRDLYAAHALLNDGADVSVRECNMKPLD